MKKVILTAGLAACFALNSQAQLYSKKTTYAGIKVGGSAASFTGDQDRNTRYVYGFNAGVFARIAIAEPFSVQPELLYSMKGYKASASLPDNDNQRYTRLNYIDLPMALRLDLEGFFVEAGPQVGYLLSAKNSNPGEADVDVKPAYRKIDFGYLAGVGYQPTRGGLGVGIRYNAGILRAPQDVNGVEALDLHNSVVQLYLSYSPKNKRYQNHKRR